MANLVFAGREVWPFVEGGGIGRFIFQAAKWLADAHDVTILTTEAHRDRYEAMRAGRDPRVVEGATYAFVSEPRGDLEPFSTELHAWSVALLKAVRKLAPDVAEFAEYAGEAFATVHAKRSGDARLAGTTVAIRAHASAEIYYALDERRADPALAHLWALERFPIRHGDVLVWPGGDVREIYERFYAEIAEPVRISLPVELSGFEELPAPPRDGPLRLLYLGRMQRAKGVIDLVEAVRSLPDLDLRLTIVGGDTETGPEGTSMRAHLLELAGDDKRIELRGRVPHEDVPALMAAHHAVVVPTRWETYSYVVREALAAGRPVLARPVGAIPEAVVPGRSGWLGDDLREPLARMTLESALELIDAGGPRTALEESSPSRTELAAQYDQLALRTATPPGGEPGRVAAIVALQPGDAGLPRTLASLDAQDGAEVHVEVVAPPAAMCREVTRLKEGDRLAGWAATIAATDADLVALLPSGAELDPRFMTRCAAALDGFDYATCLTARGRRPWHAPLGGEAVAITGADAGASVALARRDSLEGALARGPASERELWSALSGVVIHEPLVRRYPRRAADTGEPAHGGAPDPESVARAFG